MELQLIWVKAFLIFTIFCKTGRLNQNDILVEMKSSIKQKSFSAKQGKTGPSLMGAWADTTGSTQQKRSTTITQPKTFHSGGKLFKNQNSTLFLTLLKTTRLENLFPIKRKWARQCVVWSWHFPSCSGSF